MMIDYSRKSLIFTKGEECRQYMPVLVGTLTHNAEGARVRMRYSGPDLLVVEVYPENEEALQNIYNDILNWSKYLAAWKKWIRKENQT